MVNWLKRVVYLNEAIGCINDACSVRVYIFIIGRNSDGNRLLLNAGLELWKIIAIEETLDFDFDVGSLGSRVDAVGGVIATT